MLQEADLDAELAEADARRAALEAGRIKRLAELSGAERGNSARTKQGEEKQEAALQQRRFYLIVVYSSM